MASMTDVKGVTNGISMALASLSDGSYYQSDSVAASGAYDHVVRVKVTVPAGSGDANGYGYVFVAPSQDNANFAGGASGNAGSYAPNPSAGDQSKNMHGPVVMAMDASTGPEMDFEVHLSVRKTCGFMPAYYSVVFDNECGQSLGATAADQQVTFQTSTPTSA